MHKPKTHTAATPASTSSNDAQASISVLAQIVERAKKAQGADGDLLSILEKHILKADPKENAPESATKEIQTLAQARAAQTVKQT